MADVQAIFPALSISDQAIRSWLNDSRRTLSQLYCPVCRQPARIRRGLLVCSGCHRGWPVDDIMELSDELLGIETTVLNHGTGPGIEPPQVDPGPVVSTANHRHKPIIRCPRPNCRGIIIEGRCLMCKREVHQGRNA